MLRVFQRNINELLAIDNEWKIEGNVNLATWKSPRNSFLDVQAVS